MAVRFGQTFAKNEKVTHDLDPDGEILIVVRSGYMRTQCVTLDGLDVSHSTVDLSYAQIPAAI